jgi:N-acetylmuramoyl-L-alanine amidase
VEVPLQFRHPHQVDQFIHPHRLRVTLYGVTADTDRIRYKSEDSVVNEIAWHQTLPDVMTIDIETKQDLGWGYDVRYEGTALVIEIRHKPIISSKGGSLRGLKVAVDAGHSTGSFGTIGPLGNTEASINLMAAKVVKQELEKRGAEVVMTQDGTKEISLQERVNLAWKEKAQLFISIHADACEAGTDPREVEGYSVHYYQPQSKDLATLIHEEYGKRTPFRDQGLWRSNLAVCRTTQMPSILLEQAFLMIPEFEDIMLTPKHHRNVADSIIAAITQLLEGGKTKP